MQMSEERFRAWYSVQTYSGMEDVVKKNIETRTKSMNMEEYIFRVLVPERTYRKRQKNGDVKTVREKPFSGYVFVDMIVTDETWFMVRNTPMVTGFLGSRGGGAKPVPIPDEEMKPILMMSGELEEKPISVKIGDRIEITSGTFTGHAGTVSAIDCNKRLLTVLIDVFGRPTPAEITFDEVKIN